MAASVTSSGERNAGLLLMAAAAAALVVANTSMAGAYDALLHARVGPLDVHHWIADGLMALFFLLVGLEVKREWYDGQLATPAARRLPMIAAAAGMAAPALVYLYVVSEQPALAVGWAIPAATDIAFALGVLALIGPRAPPSIKLLLVTIAIIDDVGAVAIIALFYTDGLNLPALGAAIAIVAAMAALNMFGVRRLWPFLTGFAALWVAVYLSGVHATIAGVVAALTIPLGIGEPRSPLKWLEHRLHPWVMFGIVPLFGFASAGVAIGAPSDLLQPLPLGIALGLLIGKPAGVFGAIWIADRLGIALKPAHLLWRHILGAAVLTGIGFTMSLFIGALAFPDRPDLIDAAKLGTLGGSILAGVLGYAALRFSKPIPATARDDEEVVEIFGEDANEDPTVCNDRFAR